MRATLRRWNQVDIALGDILNTLGGTGMAVGAFIALFLDNTIPGTPEERGLVAWGVVGEPSGASGGVAPAAAASAESTEG